MGWLVVPLTCKTATNPV